MFTKLIDKFTTKLHIQLSDKNLKVTNLKTGYTYEDKPLIAIERDKKGREDIVAIGKNASIYPDAINPFSHPRVIIDNFKIAGLILRHAFEEATQKKAFFAPIAIVNVTKHFDTPLSEIEKIALCELCQEAGARETMILEDENFDIEMLVNEKLKQLSFSCTGRYQ
jgi:rod shape-determining protein MreB